MLVFLFSCQSVCTEQLWDILKWQTQQINRQEANCLRCAETKVGLKLGDNRMYSSRVTQSCIKIHYGVDSHLVFGISWFLVQCLVVPVPLMLHTKFCEDRPFGSTVISVLVSHRNAWGRDFWPFWGEQVCPQILAPKSIFLSPSRFFWHIMCENWFSGLGCTPIQKIGNG